MVGLSVLRNKLDLVANVLVLVSFVISWTWCSPYFGLSVLRNKLVLVGFPVKFETFKFSKIYLIKIDLFWAFIFDLSYLLNQLKYRTIQYLI